MPDRDVENEALVLVGYAATMEAVQQFELALKELAVQRNEMPSGIDPDTAWKRVEKLLRRPLGQLGYAFPDGLEERYRDLKRTRNHLAHEFLLLWRFERNLELRPDEDVVAELVGLKQEFGDLAAQLSELADQHLRELGLDPDALQGSREEMRRMILGDDPQR